MLYLLFFANLIVLGQTPEQIALDFYAEKILQNSQGANIRYDGQVSTENKLENLASHIVSEYYFCKMQTIKTKNRDSIKIILDEYNSEISPILQEQYQFINLEEKRKLQLTTPKNIKFKKELKSKKLKGGSVIRFHIKKIWRSIFPMKSNLVIEPAVFYRAHYYVWLKVSTLDSLFGKWYFIKISKNHNVIDYCSSSWMQ